MTVPPITVAPAGNVDTISAAPLKPNWIQDAEAIAKADINRLEVLYKTMLGYTRGSVGLAWAALVVACIALVRTCH